ncbi:MAG: methionyl-tRNA formyltransferase [Patescibacteria group bacterium]|nr:methionyl-tRNA formyltransferase [Patescibacteria group bacterium]
MTSRLKDAIKSRITAANKRKKKDKRGPTTKHQLLAVDIAESFGKLKSRRDVAILMNLCKKQSNARIMRIWGIVKEKEISNKMAYFLAILRNINKEERMEKVKKVKIIFIGSSEFAVPILQELLNRDLRIIAVITQIDRPVGRKKILTATPIKKFAQERRLTILQPLKISLIKNKIKKLNPDLIITAAYGQIVPQAILDIPKHKCLNIHPSLLPKYRGSSPIQNAILNGDRQTAVSIMIMDAKMDHGDIIAKKRLKIIDQNYTQLRDELSELGADLLVKVLPDYLVEKIKAKPQNHKNAIFTKILQRADGQVDWRKKAIEIERQVRAFYPWPGSWSFLSNNKKLKIIQVSLLRIVGAHKNVGEIFLTDDKKMGVLCGHGSLVLERVQLEGKKEMSGREFMLGRKVDRFVILE